MWFCALVPDYVPRSWCIKCMCIHCKSVRIARARQTIRRTKLVLQILFHFGIDNSSPFTGINGTSAVSVNPSRLGNSRAHDHLSKEYFASSSTRPLEIMMVFWKRSLFWMSVSFGSRNWLWWMNAVHWQDSLISLSTFAFLKKKQIEWARTEMI